LGEISRTEFWRWSTRALNYPPTGMGLGPSADGAPRPPDRLGLTDSATHGIAVAGVNVLTVQHVSQREFWNGPPEELRELFSLTNARHAHARCALWSHQFGWELRLTVSGSLIRIQVCRAFGDVMAVSDEWKAPMQATGWQ
jgi:hypothetical protein